MPFPSPGDLPDSGIEPESPALRADAFLTFVLLVQYETPRKGQTLPVSLNILARAVALGLGAWVLEPNHLGLNPVLPLASSVTLDRGFDMFIIPFSHL